MVRGSSHAYTSAFSIHRVHYCVQIRIECSRCRYSHRELNTGAALVTTMLAFGNIQEWDTVRLRGQLSTALVKANVPYVDETSATHNGHDVRRLHLVVVYLRLPRSISCILIKGRTLLVISIRIYLIHSSKDIYIWHASLIEDYYSHINRSRILHACQLSALLSPITGFPFSQLTVLHAIRTRPFLHSLALPMYPPIRTRLFPYSLRRLLLCRFAFSTRSFLNCTISSLYWWSCFAITIFLSKHQA